VTSIEFIALARQYDDTGAGGMGENVGDQGEAFIRPVWRGRQSQIDEGQRGSLLATAQAAHRFGAG
jgi:hypothetical protein